MGVFRIDVELPQALVGYYFATSFSPLCYTGMTLEKGGGKKQKAIPNINHIHHFPLPLVAVSAMN